MVTNTITFPGTFGKYMSLASGRLAEDVMLNGDITQANGANAGDWVAAGSNYSPNILLPLAICFILRFLVQACTNPLPLPGGILVPLMATGAVFGRFFGELFAIIFPNGFLSNQKINPGIFAFIGAGALPAGVTQAFATSIILLEMGGTTAHVPCIVAVIASIRISKMLTCNYYDMIIGFRGWAGVVLAPQTDRDDMVVKQMMAPIEQRFISSKHASLVELKEVYHKYNDMVEYPIVDSVHNRFLVGIVPRADLKDHIAKLEEEIATTTPQEDAINQQEVQSSIPVPCRSASYVVSDEVSAIRAHTMFSMVKIEQMYVQQQGRLVGLVRRQDVIDAKTSQRKASIVQRAWGTVKSVFCSSNASQKKAT